MNKTFDSNNKSTMIVMIIAVVALLAIISYALIQAPDRRTTGEKLGDAVNNITDGVEDAGRSMQNRTPAQKIGDAVEDAGDKVERATD